MKTLERAAEILRNANTLDGLSDLFTELGFSPPLLPLDQSARDALGLDGVRDARIVTGNGALRGLAVELDRLTDMRAELVDIANSLSRNAPELLWIVVALHARQELAVVCWRSGGSRVRIASLICRISHVVQSDAETLCMLSAVGDESDLLTHARWLDVLGRESITNRFFRVLERTVIDLASSLTGEVPASERRELALLYISRLIFLSFLETKGWLNGDFCFLSNTYVDCIANGGRYQKRILEPLFFGTLNTRVRSRSQRTLAFGRVPFLNGGLFARSVAEKRWRSSVFSDDTFGEAFGNLFCRFRFTGREDSTTWSDASIDPEILGKAFEALMASSDRKNSGSYYTPQTLVERLADQALQALSAAPDDDLPSLQRVKVLDPACGSGAFLVYALERLAAQRQLRGEHGSIADIRRRVLSTSIFGVDLNPMAVWLCELRLWLSIVVESDERDPMKIVPLPNLDRHIRVGDSLAAGSFDDRGSVLGSRKLASVRTRYMRAVGPRKRTLGRELDRIERASAIDVLTRQRVRLTVARKELLLYLRARDLFGLRHPPDQATQLRLAWLRQSTQKLRMQVVALRAGAALPFSFDAHFPDIAAAGGFDCIIGNPPWVRVHRIEAATRHKFKQDFRVYRCAPWARGAEHAGAGRGFAAQIDLSALFVERGCGLVRENGVVAYLLPSKLWRSLAGGGVRELLLEHTGIVMIEDLAGTRSEFDAAVYPSLLIARKRECSQPAAPVAKNSTRAVDDFITITVRTSRGGKRWRCPSSRLSIDGPGSPWLLLPGAVRRSFDRVTKAGVPLRITPFGRPQLGVKTGCNEAFVVRVDSVDGDIAHISSGERVGVIERSVLRPLIRGEALAKWKISKPGEYIVWPHDDAGRPLAQMPPLARLWLAPFRDALARRTDLHNTRRWWSVFRTEGAVCDEPRVVWADFGLHPRAMVFAANDRFVPLNTCYAVRIPKITDAFGLAAILNGPVATAWLNAIAEPARGGYRRYLGWTMAMLPVPPRWGRVRKVLSPLGERAMEGEIPSESDLLDAALDAYRLRREKVQPLLDWGIACD